ncbi:MAG: c-type cytochrome [Pirellulaceae bacterium]|nr:c-type cytochrome [Pirellulaceae bacterium]
MSIFHFNSAIAEGSITRPLMDRKSLLAVLFLLALAATNRVAAQEANWIWSADQVQGEIPAGDGFFRKQLMVDNVEQATLTITADDRYDLYLNGRLVGNGRSTGQMEQYDISKLLIRGNNVVAVRVTNLVAGHAALAARMYVKSKGKSWQNYSTDATWRCSTLAAEGWQRTGFDDSTWKSARVLGLLGETAPWDRDPETNSKQTTTEDGRFKINAEFVVKEILDSEKVGSLINMAFNEFGHIIAAQESGPLLLIYDSDKDGIPDKTREYCNTVHGIQGILPLNGQVYVTGQGEEGHGVYRLTDEDHNGSIDRATRIVGFKGKFGEHGAHGLVFGPDGYIYCVLGNHVQYDGEFADSSPYKHMYEGDLIQPRMEDPGGHAAGVKAPGGSVIRFDTEGDRVELVAGGLRNAYDLILHPSGKIFAHDSDMEADEGAVWYRPTALYEIAQSGEYGWRSGWAAWPNYYFDRLPATLETGRGSPTGGCTYAHHMFPKRYHNSLFLADWSQGKILCVRLNDKDGPTSEVFIQGHPLNATDIAVGPDGALYFCTGGRGTKGGIYRISWKGKVPDSVKNLGSGLASALKQPQLDSAWARQAIAALKREMGNQWNTQISELVRNEQASPAQRTRALELMQLFGPAPTPLLLTELTTAANPEVRARAAALLGLAEANPLVSAELAKLLDDSDRQVQLEAAEALLRASYEVTATQLVPLLKSTDRRLSYTARQLLQRLPTQQWAAEMLDHGDQRVKLQSGLALVTVDPSRENCLQVLNSVQQMLGGFISDRNFIDVLRLTEVALHRGGLSAAAIPELTESLAKEYPVGDRILNRELFRILAFLNCQQIVPTAVATLQQDLPLEERMLTALHLSLMKHSWTTEQRYAIVKFFEQAIAADAGSSVPLYVMQLTRRLCKDLTLEEARVFVAEGARWPNAALVGLHHFPDRLTEEDLKLLKQVDMEIDQKGFEAEQYKRLRTGIVALLSQHGDDQSQAYLREAWVRSPERRQAIALGLAQFPSDENWDYLIRSFPVLETYAVAEVMQALLKIPAATDDSQAIRHVILHGLRMQADGQSPQSAVDLLNYWVHGEDAQISTEDIETQLTQWQQWFVQQYPDEPAAELPKLAGNSAWTIETLSEYLATSEGRRGNSDAGKLSFSKAKCADCHRLGAIGQSIGPDLTSVANRFTRKEMLEATLFPSHIISDQYRSQRVLTVDGQVYTGLLNESDSNVIVVRDSNLQEHTIAREDVEEMSISHTSMMPSGLLDQLTLAEIRDLMAFLGYVPEGVQQVAQQPPAKSTR